MQIEAILSPEQAKWEQRRYELAKEMMMSMINTNAVVIKEIGINATKTEVVVGLAVQYANALIRALRNEPQNSDE